MSGEAFLTLPAPVQTALDLLEGAGHEAFVVGGCTRDKLLGTEPEDWDITTSARPEETLEVFRDYRTIPTGLKHGTVTVRIDGTLLEVTTYRVDGDYADSRHPDDVSFTRNLEEDLARRDFSMNAIAYSPSRGFKDLYGGAEDIRNRTIRCVGDPGQRFTEDALRILRALRFASVLGFSIEPATAEAIHGLKERIAFLAAERVSSELLKLLCGKDVFRVLTEYRDVFAVVLPELEPCFDFEQHNPWHCYDVYTHTCKSVEAAEPEPELRLGMLLHDIGKPQTFFFDEKGVGHFYGHGKAGVRLAEAAVDRLRLSTRQRQTVLSVVEFHDTPLEPDRALLLRRLHKFGEATLKDLIRARRADCLAQNPERAAAELDKLSTIEQMLEQLLSEAPAFQIAHLAVNGEDLMALGMEPGPQLGAFLETLLEKVMAGELPNDRSRLLKYSAGRIQHP